MKLLLSTILLAVATVAAAVVPSTAVFTSTSGNAQVVAAAADWTPPQPTLTAPVGPWRGNVTVQATATDDVSGVATVRVQTRRAGTTDWTTRCTLTPPATACVLATTTLGDGVHDLRATATDVAGNVGTSAVQQRTVDTTAPLVTLADPGALLAGTVTLQATASDATTSVASVRFQTSPAGSGQWTDRCTVTAAPFTCAWNTTSVANGAYDLRAIATDAAGNTATSLVSNRRVDNSPLAVTIADLPDVVRGTTTVTAQVNASGTSTVTVVIERRLAGTTNFTTICTTSVAPYRCDWNTATTATPDGDYELRARATSATASATSAIADTQVDNTPPTVLVQDPGATLSGDVTIRATAADPHPSTAGALGSGVATVRIEVAAQGSTAWTALCTDPTSPYTCTFATTTVPDGGYQFRAIATDVAGNVTTSAVVGPRTVDNTVSSVSLVDVPETLRGSELLRAAASSTAGVTQVTIERRLPGAATWTTICTATTAPYTCDFDTRTVADGPIELRAVLLDGAGRTLASATVTRTVDNAPVRGLDVQAFNAPGGTAGRVEAGDRIEYTYSRAMLPGSFVAGWDGRSRPVAVRLRHRNQHADTTLGSGVEIYTTTQLTQAVPLGVVRTGQDHVGPNQSLTFAGTMALVTEEVDGELRSTVVVTVGALQQGSNANWLRTAQAATMTWFPSTTPTDVDGVRTVAATVTEQGALDRDF